MIDVKRLRELEKAATPGPWRVGSVETFHVFVPHPEGLVGPGGERVLLRFNEHYPHDADADLIVWLRNNCAALLDAAERVEAIDAPRTSDDLSTAWAQKVDALRETVKLAKEEMNRAQQRAAVLDRQREEACGLAEVERQRAEAAAEQLALHEKDQLAWVDMVEENDGLKEKLLAAERRVAGLESEHERAWESLGVSKEDRETNDDPDCETLSQSVRITLDYEREQRENEREARIAAERARDEAVKARDTWRSACDASGATLLAVSEAVGIAHEQSMGPLLPASREELLEAIRGLQASRDRAQIDSEEACGRMRQQKAAMRAQLAEATRRAEAMQRVVDAAVACRDVHGAPVDELSGSNVFVDVMRTVDEYLATIDPKGGK